MDVKKSITPFNSTLQWLTAQFKDTFLIILYFIICLCIYQSIYLSSTYTILAF